MLGLSLRHLPLMAFKFNGDSQWFCLWCRLYTHTWPVWAVATPKFMTADVCRVIWGDSRPKSKSFVTFWRGPIPLSRVTKTLSYSNMLLICNCFSSGICFPCNHELKKAVHMMTGLTVSWKISTRLMFCSDSLSTWGGLCLQVLPAGSSKSLKLKHSSPLPIFTVGIDFSSLF